MPVSLNRAGRDSLRGSLLARWLLTTFREGVQFVNRVTEIAEELNHHPDFHISYKDIKLSVNTHYKGGLTPRDLRLAARIDALWQETHSANSPG